MDLPYIFSATGTMTTSASMHTCFEDSSFFSRKKKHKSMFSNTNSPLLHAKESRGDVVLFSGCRDDQTSADTTVGLVSGGAMTNAFIQTISKYPQSTYIQLLYRMRSYLTHGNRTYTQVPQLSSGKRMDMNQPFSL